MNKETGEARPLDEEEISIDRSKPSKNPTNCTRCGKPLGSTVHTTVDGPSCHSCFNDQDPEFLGIVADWEFKPASETDDVLPAIVITLTNGDTTTVNVLDREKADEVGPFMLGQECWDHGDEWVFRPQDGGGES